MSKLYMSHQSDNRKEVTRRGNGYMTTHLRGWDKGIRVVSFVDENSIEQFKVYKTGGSNSPFNQNLIYETKEI